MTNTFQFYPSETEHGNARRFVVPGQPIPKARPRVTKEGVAFTPKKTRRYEQLMRSIAAMSFPKPMKGRLGIRVRAYFSDKRRRDLDNIVKNIDSLNKIAFDDDSQIDYIEAYRLFDKRCPRLEVEVFEVDAEAQNDRNARMSSMELK